MYELFRFFFYLGITGFGGPLILIQHMREHFVSEKKLMNASEFDQVFTLIKAMPGPIAIQTAAYLGHRFYKLKGGLIAAVALLAPSFLIMIILGVFYSYFVEIKFVHSVLDGFLFSVTGVILFSLRSLVLNNYKYILFIPLVALSLLICWKMWMPEPLLIVGFGILSIIAHRSMNRLTFFSMAFLLVDWSKVFELFKICLVSGAVVFGTGFALIPVLKTNFVDQHQWISLKVFSDGVIFGQMTPGPVTITGTFLGYQISGLIGAIAATIGIFFMPVFHMVTWFPYAVRWLSKQNWINDFLIGATAAVVGSILNTIISMNFDSYGQIMFWILFVTSFVLLFFKPRTPVVFIILTSGLINLVVALAAVNSI